MTFTQIPQQYAPLGGELRYTVTAAAAGTIDLRITDTRSADLIGARRFAGSASVSFDAAPCLRRAIRFSPVTGSTGFHVAEGRCIAAVVEAGMTPAGETAPANGEKAVSPERTFLPRRNIVEKRWSARLPARHPRFSGRRNADRGRRKMRLGLLHGSPGRLRRPQARMAQQCGQHRALHLSDREIGDG